jgi:hypothetical protein
MWWILLAAGGVTIGTLPNCEDLVVDGTVTIPENATEIPIMWFQHANCSSLAINIEIPANVTEIDKYAFDDTSITGLFFASGSKLETIRFRAFNNANIAGIVTLPATVTAISADAFKNNKIEQFNIPESVTSIGVMIIDDNPKLQQVIVPGNGNWTDANGLENLVKSLCDTTDSHDGSACIKGSGNRASSILNHEDNDCNLMACESSEEEDDDSSTELGTGAIIGIAVGAFVAVSLVGFAVYQSTKSSANPNDKGTLLGSLIF